MTLNSIVNWLINYSKCLNNFHFLLFEWVAVFHFVAWYQIYDNSILLIPQIIIVYTFYNLMNADIPIHFVMSVIHFLNLSLFCLCVCVCVCVLSFIFWSVKLRFCAMQWQRCETQKKDTKKMKLKYTVNTNKLLIWWLVCSNFKIYTFFKLNKSFLCKHVLITDCQSIDNKSLDFGKFIFKIIFFNNCDMLIVVSDVCFHDSKIIGKHSVFLYLHVMLCFSNYSFFKQNITKKLKKKQSTAHKQTRWDILGCLDFKICLCHHRCIFLVVKKFLKHIYFILCLFFVVFACFLFCYE